MRHIIPISGKDSLATALVQTAREPEKDYEYFFNDTGQELPDTYYWLDEVERKTGITIQRVGKNLEDVIRGEGILPGQRSRFCTRLSKIRPMEDFLGDGDRTLYYGIRADEERTGYVPIDGTAVKYPLQEMGIDLRGVYTILDAQGLRPPAFWWESMHMRVLSKIGQEWKEAFEDWQLEQLFAWRTRSNCHFCMFQRQYEYVGLLEHYPDLFWNAVRLEREVGGDGYTWRDYPLTIFLDREKREEVKERRAKQICKIIRTALQHSLFAESGDTALTFTSCGPLCGK